MSLLADENHVCVVRSLAVDGTGAAGNERALAYSFGIERCEGGLYFADLGAQ